ncbi:class A beta-lactamase [Sphingomonas sp. IC-56]|uniref:class A beta-lactamase n=1 Tax=Sphingomonas sp. IC-56 TaxID=2898529 RepID=UPI001E563813|nr:class A beta-lactamase [Sphingomonas sp. IC-56]MCD2323612.1 class A beta-lactamase [Sphingomonas sp. IC-56]
MTGMPLTRRGFAAVTLGGAAAATLAPSAAATAADQIAALEARAGGRLGVLAIDTGSGARIAHRTTERFAMCSTHKVLVGAAILSAVEAGTLRLDDPIPYGANDLLEYAPVTRRNLPAGAMTVETLCEAAIRWSDNTADNLLLKRIGGPAGWTRYARSIGDTVSRLDRYEPELNSAVPGDPRDTSTPEAMSRALAAMLFGDALSDASRTRLKGWMFDSEITAKLFRAGLPRDWHTADKSGSGDNGSRNNAGILYPPRAAPILLSVFYTGAPTPMAQRDSVIARCATIVADTFKRA